MEKDAYRRFLRTELQASAGQRFMSEGREYILEGKVDDGAIGVVRKARDVASGEQVAVKFLAPELRYIEVSSLEDIHARFRREGITADFTKGDRRGSGSVRGA